MSNDNRKSPFSGLTEGDEEDWDKALNAWELPSDAQKKEQAASAPKPAKPPAPPPPRPAPPPPPKRPPVEAPRPGIPTPTAPPMQQGQFDDVPRANFESFDDDEDDATIVARVSRELLQDAGAQSAAERGSGLGQVLKRREELATTGEPADALLEMLF